MKILKPFFCYYGGKWRAANKYPAPLFETIIEPFAGAAGYSCLHYKHNVILHDVDPIIYGLWNYLINVTPEEILSIPTTVTHLDDMNLIQEQKWLIGFWINKGGAAPKKSMSKWMRLGQSPSSWWGDAIKNRIASQVPLIKHWKIYNTSYDNAPNIKATWFIDPPYSGNAGKMYSCKFNDYEKLASYCQNRIGQTIVCEQTGATWLPFENLCSIRSNPSSRGKSYSAEAVWFNNTH